MSDYRLDQSDHFVISNYNLVKPFASFLPGIAGVMGIPMWVFYVNRGQAIASFGIENKDNPVMEFLPANKAYQNTPYVGFRTFLKLTRRKDTALYEPFSPWHAADDSQMLIGMNELELQATSTAHGVQTNVLYFTLPGEDFAGLVRQVTVKNVGDTPVTVEMLDGMPRVVPYGVNNWFLKELGRTIEAWMAVFNMDQGVPFYRLQSSIGDITEVTEFRAGHFYLAFTEQDGHVQLLPAFVDPTVIFGHNTSLNTPDRLAQNSLAELQAERQVTVGRTPCGFFGIGTVLEPADTVTVYAIIGHVSDVERLHRQQDRIAQVTYVRQKREESERLIRRLTDVVDTQTSLPIFDAYCRQTFLDNVMRGGWPLILGSEDKSFVYHVYSRKHGDLERDYNAFYVAAEMYSQGNGNYRDVNQNRRCDVLLNPKVEDFNVLAFLELTQADGYNPLVVNGSRFTVPAEKRASVLALVKPACPESTEGPDKLEPTLGQPFTPGQLLKTIADHQIELTVTPEEFVTTTLTHAEQHFEAVFGEGYWIDHWFYNLDLIDTYLAVYPDKKDELLFGKPIVPFYDGTVIVQPRVKKHVLVDGEVRQYEAVAEDEGKAVLIAFRTETPNLVRTVHGHSAVYRTTVFAKLVGLALIKFATLDPLGMGIEMEAGRPGWYDALNGLPGLLGSSLCETYELKRLLTFLLEAMAETGERAVRLPIEQHGLLKEIEQALAAWRDSTNPDRDHSYWDAIATARETYRERVRLGFDGQTISLAFAELAPVLTAFRAKVQAGIERAVALNDGIPPTYFSYTATDYELVIGLDGVPQHDEHGRPYVRVRRFEPHVLPLFLEGPVHALKVQPDVASARRLYASIRESDLFDRKLNMYKVNAPLADQPHEIGRARAFTPGWLENESIWLHMEYKYLLEVLKAELYDEFFADFKRVLIPFQDPAIYGRSLLENSSFIVSSAHPDQALHGTGFVARLSGSTAEFLNIWSVMMAGERPFFMQDGELHLAFKPVLPSWLFDENGIVTFTFLGGCQVVCHNPGRRDTFADGGLEPHNVALHTRDGPTIEIPGGVIGAPYAAMVRDGQVDSIRLIF